MSKVLFLDDNPARRRWASRNLDAASLTLVETAAEAVDALREAVAPLRPFDVAYLDHDLGDEAYVDSSREDCGMEVVRWVVANKPVVGRFVVHTMNTPAGHAMVRGLRTAGYRAGYVSFMRLAENHGKGTA